MLSCQNFVLKTLFEQEPVLILSSSSGGRDAILSSLRGRDAAQAVRFARRMQNSIVSK
jgi:hypothetical protein